MTDSMNQQKQCYTMGETTFEVDAKYKLMKPIGKGSFCVVCSSINMETEEKVAIKKIQQIFDKEIEQVEQVYLELTILRQMKHDNVIGLKDVMMPTSSTCFDDLYLVFELMDTDLNRIIRSSQPLSHDHCYFYMKQILCGVKYLHSTNVLHRDLKPGNLLVNADSDLKICDFGLATTTGGHDELPTDYFGTRQYRAPELLLDCSTYGSAVDMWSVGCIFAEILGRKVLFVGDDSISQIKLIIDVLGTQKEADLTFIDNNESKELVSSLPNSTGMKFSSLFPEAEPLAIDLLERMLVFYPRKRISATEALSHPYFSDVHDDSSCDPPPAPYPKIHSDIIDDDMGKEVLREMILKEIRYYHQH